MLILVITGSNSNPDHSDLTRALKYIRAYDIIHSTSSNGELDSVRRKATEMISELSDKL